MNNLINFIYDLKDTVRTKQNNATLNSQDFILNNFENEINAIKKGDLFDYYSIIDNRLRLIRFDPVKMNINIEKWIEKEPKSSKGARSSGRLYFQDEYLKEIKNLENINIVRGNDSWLNYLFCFRYCTNLEYVNFYNWSFIGWNKGSITAGFFYNCNNLKTVDLSNWDTSYLNPKNGAYALFDNCKNLQNVYLNNWDCKNFQSSFWDSAFENVPSNCIVWVKDGIAYNSIKSTYPSLDVRPCVPLGGVDPESKDMMEGTVRKYSISFYGNSPDIEAHKLGLGVTEPEYPLSYYGTEADNYGRPIINYETNTIDFCVKAAEGTAGSTATLSFTLSDTLGNSWSFTCDFSITPYVERGYTVSDISGASYGFKLNSNGYYESQNKGIDSSYAICRVDFHGTNKIIFDCINYAESNYDFGILSNIDSTLSLSSGEDSSTAVFKSFKGQQSPDIVSVVYEGIDSQDHFIYVKYKKDSSADKNYDSLQFKIRFE